MNKKLLILSVFFIAAMMVLSNGCYYDVEEELYPNSGCDTATVTYAGTIKPMLSNNGCLSCHAAPATNGGGNVLDNYAAIKQLVDAGVFVSGAARMPPGSPVLGDCNIDKIQAWVNAGALEN